MGGFFGEEFFGRNFLVDFYKELMFLSRFWGNLVSMEGRRKEEGRRILDPKKCNASSSHLKKWIWPVGWFEIFLQNFLTKPDFTKNQAYMMWGNEHLKNKNRYLALSL